MAKPVDSSPVRTVLGPRFGQQEQELRDICDEYWGPNKFGNIPGLMVTCFDGDDMSFIRDLAKATIDAYNHVHRTSFHLHKVVKFNCNTRYFFMTFWAESESEGRHLFRGVANPNDIIFCEIKTDGRIWIPDSHKDSETQSEDVSSPDTCRGLIGIGAESNPKVDSSPVRTVLGTRFGQQAQELRDICDGYWDPIIYGNIDGQLVTCFDGDDISIIKDLAKATIDAYNHDHRTSFHLHKVVKVNFNTMNFYMTFWAESESEGRRLFRGVANPSNIIFCEIKE